ncbi:MAG: hypothetical protein ACLFNO_02405 [Parcubacteria group bacterium]
MKSEFLISKIETGQLNAMVKNIMMQTGINNPIEAMKIVNAGEVELSLKKQWTEKDGLIYFSVSSDGTSGKDWISRLENQDFKVGKYAKSVLLSKDFKPGKPMTYEIAILKGEIFKNNVRTTKNMRAEAKKLGLKTATPELACLIREKFTNNELRAMGLYWIVTMHKPIKDFTDHPTLLCSECVQNSSQLRAHHDSVKHRWYRVDGFAFVVSESFN